ncbi:MAG: lipopolysaccharide transport periplasmic protein LptA [Desulfobulbaceae bacterium]|nr:lipopolysaccharide transport periplasmic protein LptA [Desulfobulbaceae bacterium]
MNRTFSICLLFFLAIMPINALGAQGLDADAPIHIEANKMVSKQKENIVIFTGNVEAEQGGLVIHADEMTVYHKSNPVDTDKEQGNTQKIQKLFAIGNVKIIQEGLIATGNEMEFFADDRKVLITGNTKVWQDKNLVTGDKIMLDLNTETTVIEPDKEGGGRVKAFFYPEKN